MNHKTPGRVLTEVNEGNEELVGTSFPLLPSVTSRRVHGFSGSAALRRRPEFRTSRCSRRRETRQKLLAAKGHVPAFLALAILALWSAFCPVMANEPGSLTLTIGIYSGRRNPELDLQETEAAVVLQMLSEASPAPAQDPATAFLGLRCYGLYVGRWGTNNLIESVTRIRGTNVVAAGSGLKESWFYTQDARLEEYLLNLAYARGVISFDMYDYILCETNPQRRTFLLSVTKTASGNREATLNWPCVPGVVAVLQRTSPAAGVWNLGSTTTATNWTIALTNTSGFFRVQRCMPGN